MDIQKGMRQPQEAKASLVMVVRQAKMMPKQRKKPTVAVVWIQLVL